MISLDINQIQKIIPQRFPMLMIDKIVSLEPGKRVVAIKNITMNEQFFQGHFPNDPVMPGALIVEAMAQTSTFLFYQPENSTQKLNFLLGAIKDARFFRIATPGDQLTITAEAMRLGEDTAYVKVLAMISNEKVSEGELIFVRKKEKK